MQIIFPTQGSLNLFVKLLNKYIIPA